VQMIVDSMLAARMGAESAEKELES